MYLEVKIPAEYEFRCWQAQFWLIRALSTVSKVLEAILKKRMVNFLLKHSFFNNNQFGFLPRKSTSEALVTHLNEIVNNLERSKTVFGLYLDLAKAFDTVNHDILFEKLHRAGFRGDFYNWLKSCVQNRQQCVVYNGNRSEWRQVICGVPQGSTLGPLLFLVYVNSILELPLQGPVFSFADDTAIVYSGVDFEESRKKCETDLETLTHWFIFHKICPNLKKTKLIQYFYKTTKNVQSPAIIWHLPNCLKNNCNCTEIERVTEIKYLGLFLNSNLNWQAHSAYLQTKLRKLNYLLYYLKNSIPMEVRLRVYLAFYLPVLTYSLECWGGAPEYMLQPIRVLQKGAVRAIVGAKRYDHSAPILSKLKTLSLSGLYKQSLISLLHRGIVKIPKKKSGTKHLRFSRFVTPQWKHEKARRQALYQSLLQSSKLPQDLITYLGHPTFPRKLKTFIIISDYYFSVLAFLFLFLLLIIIVILPGLQSESKWGPAAESICKYAAALVCVPGRLSREKIFIYLFNYNFNFFSFFFFSFFFLFFLLILLLFLFYFLFFAVNSFICVLLSLSSSFLSLSYTFCSIFQLLFYLFFIENFFLFCFSSFILIFYYLLVLPLLSICPSIIFTITFILIIRYN